MTTVARPSSGRGRSAGAAGVGWRLWVCALGAVAAVMVVQRYPVAAVVVLAALVAAGLLWLRVGMVWVAVAVGFCALALGAAWWGVPLAVQLGVVLAAAGGGALGWQRPGARLRRGLGRGGWLGGRQWWGAASAAAARRQVPAPPGGRAARLRRVLVSGAAGAGVPGCRQAGAAYGARVGRVVSGGLLVRGRATYSPWSRGILVLGPPGAGKSSWLAQPILDAPGAAYVSSTKTELVAMTAQLRAERGPVWVFNPTGLGGVASTFGWNPLAGCGDAATADARARALVRGGGGAASGQHAEFWAAKAAEIVRCYLLAAAIGEVTMAAVMDWALNPTDPTPVSLLEDHPHLVPQGWVGTLQRNLAAAPNERSGYFSAVVPAVTFMDNPLVAAACTPVSDQALDVEAFVAGSGTVYVVAGDDRRVAPLLTALTEAVFDAAKRVAATRPGGRLSPPLGFFLDEIANTTPVPLDGWAADSRGWGITVCAVAQDLAQLESRWGRTRAQTIFSNLPTKVVLPGVANSHDLDALAYLGGHRFVRQVSEGASEGGGGRSRSTQRSWTREPVVTGPAIYGLPRWHAYVLGLGPHPVVVRFAPGYRTTAAALRRLRRTRRVPLGWETAEPIRHLHALDPAGVVTPLRPRPRAVPPAPTSPGAVPRPAASSKLLR